MNTEKNKSAMLLWLIGWMTTELTRTPAGETKMIFLRIPGKREHWLPWKPGEFSWMEQASELAINLYRPENMALAWRVLNWIMNYPMVDDDSYQFVTKFQFSVNIGDMMRLPPAKAMAAWLDRILFLAMEAGKFEGLPT